MNEATLNNISNSIFGNFGMLIPKGLYHSSDSSVEELNRSIDFLIQDKLSVLKNTIGEELFNRLSYEDRMLMVETAGMIDFGHPIDLDIIAQNIKEYGYTE